MQGNFSIPSPLYLISSFSSDIIRAMVKLIVVRHAKTLWNLSGKIQGRSDIPLADESRTAARALGETLLTTPIDAAYSSPLSRAFDTAELILSPRKCGNKVIKDERLLERDFGDYEGKTYTELGLDDHTKLFYALDGIHAEPCEDVFKRVRSFVLDLKEKHDGQSVLIVSHGVCISFLTYALTHEKWNADEYDMNYIPNLKELIFEL